MHKSSYSIDMPGSYYWEGLDNFFHKLTAMESPRKNNDCYFYYYSTCTKGDNCTFRHEPSALGCETMCSYWQQGKCLNQHCNFRHMELRKNRKAIPCYWETQPSGCRKPHCPFQHKNPREPPVNAEPPTAPAEAANEHKDRPEWNRRQVLDNNQYDQPTGELTNSEIECARPASRRISQTSSDATSYGSPSVDPLVVNFEEESDNESTTTTPVKLHMPRTVGVKTLEEIRLEKIQAESAAFYSYDLSSNAMNLSIGDDTGQEFRRRIYNRFVTRKTPTPDFQILSLTEIRKRKLQSASDEIAQKVSRINPLETVRRVLETSKKSQRTINTLDSIKIKTLAEIRAERASKRNSGNTSTRDDNDLPARIIAPPKPLRRLKRSLSSDEGCQDTFSKRVLLRKKSYTDISLLARAEEVSRVLLPDNNNSPLKDSHMLIDPVHEIDAVLSSNGNCLSEVPDIVAHVTHLSSERKRQRLPDDEFTAHNTFFDSLEPNHTFTVAPAEDILQDIDALLDDD